MNEISPAVQALIDRIACLNPARPRFDQAAIERSLSAFLAALDLENRPILWVDDGMSAYRLMGARTREDSPALGNKLQVRMDAWGTVAPTGKHDIAFEAKKAAQQVAPPAVRGLVYDLARMEGLDAPHAESALEDAIAAVEWAAANEAMQHPAVAKAAMVFLHLFEAFEAGLCLYWVTSEDIVCVPQPALLSTSGALHREEPAILWAAGHSISLRNGRIVPKPEMIRSEALQLLDRALRMDFSAPRVDRPAAERAMNRFLEMLGQPLRPFLWMDGPQEGFRHLQDRLTAQADALQLDDTSDWSQLDSTDKAFDRARGDLRDQINTARDWNNESAPDVSADGTLLPDMWTLDLDRVIYDAATSSGATKVVRKLDGRIIEGPVSVPKPQAVASHAAVAISDADLLAARPPSERERLARAWLPMFEGFEAGLSMFWITPEEVVCIPQPAMSIQAGRLHRSDGPAVKWPGGEAYYFYQGTLVPPQLIEHPETITIETIHAQSDPAVRLCAAERYGVARYLRDSNARLVHQEDHCRLWEVAAGQELWRVVEARQGNRRADQPSGTTLWWCRMRWEREPPIPPGTGWTLYPPQRLECILAGRSDC
jgi:hypothetical protein